MDDPTFDSTARFEDGIDVVEPMCETLFIYICETQGDSAYAFIRETYGETVAQDAFNFYDR